MWGDGGGGVGSYGDCVGGGCAGGGFGVAVISIRSTHIIAGGGDAGGAGAVGVDVAVIVSAVTSHANNNNSIDIFPALSFVRRFPPTAPPPPRKIGLIASRMPLLEVLSVGSNKMQPPKGVPPSLTRCALFQHVLNPELHQHFGDKRLGLSIGYVSAMKRVWQLAAALCALVLAWFNVISDRRCSGGGEPLRFSISYFGSCDKPSGAVSIA